MKKLLLGAITALAFLFGFASCSGNLMDLETEKLYLAGDMNSYTDGGVTTTDSGARNTFTKVNENTQTYKFIYHNDMGAWGNGNGKLAFKVCYDASSWKLDWGWKQDIPVSLVVNDTEWLELEHRDSANSNPGNIVVEDLLDGEEYTIEVDYDAPATSVKIKIYGNKPDFPSLRFVVVDKDGNTVKEIPLTRDGVSYSGEFASETAGAYSGYLTNGYLYWGSNGDFQTDASKVDLIDFEVEKDESGNIKVCNIKVKVDPANLSSIKNIKIGDTSILAEATVVGPKFGYDAAKIPLVFKDAENSELEFETFDDSGEVEFQILETSGNWWPRWYAGTDGKTDIIDAGIAKKTVAPAVDGTSVEPLYEEKELEYGKDKSIKFTGLPCVAGKKFVIKVKILDEDSKKISISCEPAEGEKLTADDYTKVPPKEMFVTVAGVSDPIKMTKDDAVYSYTLENDELASIGESITISKVTYDDNDYGIASGTTVNLDTPVSLLASGNAITLPIDTNQYKSYTFKVDTSNGLKLTVTAVKTEFTLYMVGAPNYTTTNVFTEMTKLNDGFLGYTFKYKTAMSANWGSPTSGIAFKLALGNNVWDGAYGGFDLTVDSDYVEAEAGSDKNGSVDNLVNDTTYTLLAQVTKNADGNVSSVKVKIIKGIQLFMVGAPNYTTTNVFTPLTIVSNGISAYEFQYKTAMSANWGSPTNGIAFKLALGNNVWDGAYGGFDLTVDGDYVEAEAGSDKNGSVGDLVNDTTYVVSAKYDADKVFVKIEKKN